jgi:hypothetical protein
MRLIVANYRMPNKASRERLDEKQSTVIRPKSTEMRVNLFLKHAFRLHFIVLPWRIMKWIVAAELGARKTKLFLNCFHVWEIPCTRR